MTSPDNPRALPLDNLEARCASETLRFYQHEQSDTRFCYEIFRRALVERDQAAWYALVTAYEPQISRWIRKHRGFALCGEDEAYFVNRALEKLWGYVKPERFASFPDLPQLLTYLQMCVNSAIGEHLRLARKHEVERRAAEQSAADPVVASPEAQVEIRVQTRKLLELIASRLPDEKEKIVLEDSFVLGLKPAEIFQLWPGTFENVREIYRIKESLLERLRCMPELARLAGFAAE